MKANEVISRRQYLIYSLIRSGAPIFMAYDAVSSTAMEHPEWDMDEQKTLAEWSNI